ncbi:MAG: roadblock/LC7 domain-containing protein [Candidatus Heimdallarchaeaceae archaeon]
MVIELTQEQKNQLLRILRDISRECNLGAIAVVSFEGRELAFFAEKGTDPVVMSALASALNAAGLQAMKQIRYGNLDQVIIKGTEGFLLLQNIEQFIVLAASREIYSLALAMNVLSRYSKTIYQALTS